MVALFLSSILMLAIAGHTNAAYCVCKQGVSEALLQKNIDYACGVGADCTPILQNGPCFNPNTIQDHCNWAVNSYYQKKGQITGSCDFVETAMMSTTPPSQSSSCVYPASPSGGSTGTPPTNPGTPTPVNPSPGTSTGTGTGFGTGTGGTSTGIPGTTGGLGIAPSATSYGGTDNINAGMTLHQTSNLAIVISLVYFVIMVM